MRWFVGDVQGCVRPLERLLKEIGFDPETLRLWRDVGGRGVLGNHEIYALMVHAGRWPRKEDTLDALRDAPDAELLFRELATLPVLSRVSPSATRRGEDGPEVWVVHAGLDPRWTDLAQIEAELAASPRDLDFFEREEVSCATRIRCCTATGERARFHGVPEECPPPFQPWDQFYKGSRTVVHGHWAWRGHYRNGAVIGLDSGCVYGGPLTAWSPDSDQVVQVAATA
ncbi:MAG: hypothetical protein ACPHRO_09015 [Nannocystaceae bacterium]